MTGSNTASSLLAPFIENLYRMAWIVEARDPYTGGHLWRVSQYARLLAEDLGLDADEVARAELGGFLHDLGKVGIPDAVLNKPGPLDDHEYALIKTHPRIGARLLRGHPLAALAHEAVLMHHEMPDGRGYPDGLSGEGIPLIARILVVGQAPGIRVHNSGVPFDDASGDRLREWMGITREVFYDPLQMAIVPMGFCYPGTGKSGDLPPRPECAPHWRQQVLAHLHS